MHRRKKTVPISLRQKNNTKGQQHFGNQIKMKAIPFMEILKYINMKPATGKSNLNATPY